MNTLKSKKISDTKSASKKISDTKNASKKVKDKKTGSKKISNKKVGRGFFVPSDENKAKEETRKGIVIEEFIRTNMENVKELHKTKNSTNGKYEYIVSLYIGPLDKIIFRIPTSETDKYGCMAELSSSISRSMTGLCSGKVKIGERNGKTYCIDYTNSNFIKKIGSPNSDWNKYKNVTEQDNYYKINTALKYSKYTSMNQPNVPPPINNGLSFLNRTRNKATPPTHPPVNTTPPTPPNNNNNNRNTPTPPPVNNHKISGGGTIKQKLFEKITTDIYDLSPINDRVNAFIEATQHIEACDSIFSPETDVKCGKNKYVAYGRRALLGKKLIKELGDVNTNNSVQLIEKTEEWGKLSQNKWKKLEKGKATPNNNAQNKANKNAQNKANNNAQNKANKNAQNKANNNAQNNANKNAQNNANNNAKNNDNTPPRVNNTLNTTPNKNKNKNNIKTYVTKFVKKNIDKLKDDNNKWINIGDSPNDILFRPDNSKECINKLTENTTRSYSGVCMGRGMVNIGKYDGNTYCIKYTNCGDYIKYVRPCQIQGKGCERRSTNNGMNKICTPRNNC